MKILYWGDSPTVNTGFGVVSKNILKYLHDKGHEIVVLGINHWGDPYDTKEFPFPIYSCDKGAPEHQYGYRKLWSIAKQFQPDLLFVLNDPWVIEKALSFKDYDSPYMKVIAYFPLDSGPLKPEWAEMLRGFDAQVCYSHFAEGILTEANGGKRPDNLYQIYHGVDTKVYRPVVQDIARSQLGIPLNSFVVGMVARNQYRKRFDILCKAFARFAKDKKDAKLYLHTHLEDVGFDIRDLVRQFDLADKLILTGDIQNPAHGVPDSMLNLIYNSFSVNCLISLGDGFGLPVAESMATGCPQLVSDHSCLRELVSGHGGLTVKTATWLMNVSGINTWGGVTDEDDLVDKLNLLYKNRELRLSLAEDGYKYITQEKFQWPYIGEQFNTLINNTFHVMNKVA